MLVSIHNLNFEALTFLLRKKTYELRFIFSLRKKTRFSLLTISYEKEPILNENGHMAAKLKKFFLYGEKRNLKG